MRKDINKMTKEYIIAICIMMLGVIVSHDIFKFKIFPWLINKKTKDIEENPKWIISKTKDHYGFSDIDFIVVESPLGTTPRFRVSKDKTRLQLLIDDSIGTKDVDTLMRAALAAKIKINYGLWFPEKSVNWLSILLYMLDGGDIKQEATSWKDATKEKDKKSVDLL